MCFAYNIMISDNRVGLAKTWSDCAKQVPVLIPVGVCAKETAEHLEDLPGPEAFEPEDDSGSLPYAFAGGHHLQAGKLQNLHSSGCVRRIPLCQDTRRRPRKGGIQLLLWTL